MGKRTEVNKVNSLFLVDSNVNISLAIDMRLNFLLLYLLLASSVSAAVLTFNQGSLLLDNNITDESDILPITSSNGYFEIVDNEITNFSIHILGHYFSSQLELSNPGINRIYSDDGESWTIESIARDVYSNNGGSNPLVTITNDECYVYSTIEYDSFRIENGSIIFEGSLTFKKYLKVNLAVSNSSNDSNDIFEVNAQIRTTKILTNPNISIDDAPHNSPRYYNWMVSGSFMSGEYLLLEKKDNITLYNTTSSYNIRSLIFMISGQPQNNFSSDTDSDGLYNYHETDTGIFVSKQNTGSSPNNPDSDNDGILDGSEVNIYSTDPNNSDTDSDGINDRNEIFVTNTDPLNSDSNFDLINDGVSISNNIDPLGDYSELTSYISSNPSILNLYSIDDIKDLRAGSTMIEVQDGTATLSMEVEESDDLEIWTSGGTTNLQIPVDANSDTKFFRFKMADPDTTITVTVGEDTNDGQPIGVFYFNGAEKAVLEFERDTTYTFIQNDSSNATYASIHHPLMFSTGDDGEHNEHGHYMSGIVFKLDGVTKTMAEYVSGFVAASDRRIEWTVPSDAPSTLHYWCHFHTGQGAAMTVTD